MRFRLAGRSVFPDVPLVFDADLPHPAKALRIPAEDDLAAIVRGAKVGDTITLRVQVLDADGRPVLSEYRAIVTQEWTGVVVERDDSMLDGTFGSALPPEDADPQGAAR